MLRAIIGFDHIGKNLAEANWLPNNGYALTRTSGKQLLITADSWLGAAAGLSSGAATQSCLDLSSFMSPGLTSLSVGLRTKTVTAGNTGSMFFLGTVTSAADALLIFSFSHQSAAGQLAGGEGYFETVIDTVANNFTVFLDGVQIGQAALSTINVTNLRAGKLVMFMVHTTNGGSGLNIYRDIVVTDNIAGDGVTGKFGPRVVHPITLDSASGTDWTSSDGSALLTALNVPIETAGAATVVSGVSKSPLVTSLKANTLPTGANVEGISLLVSGKADVSGALTGVKLTNGSKTIDGASKAFTATLKYGNPMGVFARSPDGSRWTATNIDATTLSLTPDVAS